MSSRQEYIEERRQELRRRQEEARQRRSATTRQTSTAVPITRRTTAVTHSPVAGAGTIQGRAFQAEWGIQEDEDLQLARILQEQLEVENSQQQQEIRRHQQEEEERKRREKERFQRQEEFRNRLRRLQTQLQQDKGFFQSLMIDIGKDRERERRLIAELLRTKLPTSAEETLSLDERRLLRLPVNYLSNEERARISEINRRLERFKGGCYNNIIENDATFHLQIPNIPYTFCFDIESLFRDGLVNIDYGFADVILHLDETGEDYRYPLSSDDFERLLGQAYLIGIDTDRYYRQRLSFSDLDRLGESVRNFERQISVLQKEIIS